MISRCTLTRRFSLGCALLLALVIPARADDLARQFLEQLEQHSPQQSYDWLRAQESRYRHDPLYYDLLSRLAMDQGDYRGAIPHLQRLIQLEPRHFGGRLDLILALQLEGRSAEARQKLQELHALLPEAGEVPDTVTRQIAELDKLLQPHQTHVPRRFTTTLVASVGHDSNANRGSERDHLDIEIGGVPVRLPLSRDSLKTSDEFSEASVHFEYGQRSNNCRFETCRQWQAGAYTRRYFDLDRYNQRHLYLATRKSYAGRYQREHGLTLQNVISSRLDYGDGKVDEQNILGFDYKQRLTPTRHINGGLKLEWIDEKRRDERNSLLSTFTLSGQTRPLQRQGFRSPSRLGWELGSSWHRRPDYFAGDTLRYWAKLNYPFMIGQWQTQLSGTVRQRHDDEAFNTLFFGSTTRTDTEWLLSAQLQRHFGSWMASTRLNYEHTESNIDLFDTRRVQITWSLAYQL